MDTPSTWLYLRPAFFLVSENDECVEVETLFYVFHWNCSFVYPRNLCYCCLLYIVSSKKDPSETTPLPSQGRGQVRDSCILSTLSRSDYTAFVVVSSVEIGMLYVFVYLFLPFSHIHTEKKASLCVCVNWDLCLCEASWFLAMSKVNLLCFWAFKQLV